MGFSPCGYCRPNPPSADFADHVIASRARQSADFQPTTDYWLPTTVRSGGHLAVGVVLQRLAVVRRDKRQLAVIKGRIAPMDRHMVARAQGIAQRNLMEQRIALCPRFAHYRFLMDPICRFMRVSYARRWADPAMCLGWPLPSVGPEPR